MTEERRPDSLVGKRLLGGKLEVIRRIGEGGMGAVYEVEHRITKHRRALKVLHPEMALSADVVERFLREASVAGTLDTEHVVETYDAGRLDDDTTYVLMELLEGEALDEHIARLGRLPPERAIRIAIEICEGLAAAHDAGIVHRDLKPANVFLARGRQGAPCVKLLDFGISKFSRVHRDRTLTAVGALLGTPLYMAPEQSEGADRADERSDLYALGVILYEALSGTAPFDADTLPKLLVQIHTGERRPLVEVAPHLDPRLLALVERTLSLSPDDRPADARALEAELRALLDEGAIGDSEAAPPLSEPPRSGRRPSLALLLVLGGALTVAIAIAIAMSRVPAPVASPPPTEERPGPIADERSPAAPAPPAPSPSAPPDRIEVARPAPAAPAAPARRIPTAGSMREPAAREAASMEAGATSTGMQGPLDRDNPYR